MCSLKNEFTSIRLNSKLRQERKSSYKEMVEDTWRWRPLRWVVDRREHAKKQEKQLIKWNKKSKTLENKKKQHEEIKVVIQERQVLG